MAEERIGRRAFVVVIDACGIGALPDAGSYGDEGANTLVHLAEATGGLTLPTLEGLGLGSIVPIEGVAPATAPALHGRLRALGAGKDSTAGHWELMGVVCEVAPPTYPRGFPPEVIEHVRAAADREVICNRPYNGIDAIEHFGTEHLETGALIVYTSQDSVLQIAAHEDVVPVEDLYAICARTREEMSGEHAVGRVIARPFAGRSGAFARTEGRHDFSLPPPGRSYLEVVREHGVPVHSVGKVGQLFSGIGIDVRHPGATNARALAETTELIRSLEHGLVFTNLVETDQIYGHRHDTEGFHRALREIDATVAEWLGLLGEEDLLVLTADHGVDPAAPHTDHTREHVPLLAVFPGHGGARHDGPLADVGASALRWLTGADAPELPGDPFL
ncbi:MAG TPA: phosphopentomutase [Solirubrobacteraceae bacterium]|nr:phosphopentomutase [Solirubrobacteraceae bacterium]